MSEENDVVPEPKASLDALIDPAPLTIAQIAVLERVNSPIPTGNIDSVNDCLVALYLMSLPVREAGRIARTLSAEDIEDRALAWADSEGMSGSEYNERLSELLGACTAFWRMLPRPEAKDAKKKDTATDG